MLRELLLRLERDRDCQPHGNPAVRHIDPAWIEAYLQCETPTERTRALACLLDQLKDGHVAVDPPEAVTEDFLWAPECALALLDGRLAIEFNTHVLVENQPPPRRLMSHAEPNPMARSLRHAAAEQAERRRRSMEGQRVNGELLAIDGYEPHMMATARLLLSGPRNDPVTIRLRRFGSAETEEYRLARDSWRVSMEHPLQDLEPAAPAGIVRGSMRGGQPGLGYAATLSLDADESAGEPRDGAASTGAPRIGYLRIAMLGERGSRPGDRQLEAGCVFGKVPCSTLAYLQQLVGDVSRCDWVIVDLQSSAGGTCGHSAAISHALLPRSIEPMPFRHHERTPLAKGMRDAWDWDRTGTTTDATRFIVLIDGETFSASEHIAGVLRAVPGTRFIGTRSSGAEFSIRELRLPDETRIRYGGVAGIWTGLPPVEGHGIEPTIRVEYDPSILREKGIVEAIRDQRRRVIEAALESIRASMPEAASDPA